MQTLGKRPCLQMRNDICLRDSWLQSGVNSSGGFRGNDNPGFSFSEWFAKHALCHLIIGMNLQRQLFAALEPLHQQRELAVMRLTICDFTAVRPQVIQISTRVRSTDDATDMQLLRTNVPSLTVWTVVRKVSSK
jgi:hypothetical protein